MRNSTPFLISRDRAALLIIDMQQQLFKAMPKSVRGHMIRNIKLLIALAEKTGLPVLLTEQYPQGLGPTMPEIQQELPIYNPTTKVTFSCCREPIFFSELQELEVQSLILTGMEAHVCYMQTAIDLLNRDYRVYVANDATCSRRKSDWQTALDLMRQAGAVVSSTESLVFQILERADSETFRSMLPLIKAMPDMDKKS